MGVVTGIVQEFQFGMNWSDYSRFVGDIFGAPLAIEALLAFFLESTFLGLWIFGWDRLPKRVHLASIWIAAIGTVLSARTSSWPRTRGCRTRSATGSTRTRGRAELTDFGAVLTNKVALITFPHTIAGCVPDRRRADRRRGAVAPDAPRRAPTPTAFRSAAKLGAWTTLVGDRRAAVITGDIQGKIMTEVQPMKMAAAEAPLRHRAARPVLRVHHRHASTAAATVCVAQDPATCCRSWPPATSTARSRASTTCRPSTPPSTAPATTRPIIPVTYWTSGS